MQYKKWLHTQSREHEICVDCDSFVVVHPVNPESKLLLTHSPYSVKNCWTCTFSFRASLLFSVNNCLIFPLQLTTHVFIYYIFAKVYFDYFSFLFSWCITDLQCCINFCCTAKWFSFINIYIIFHLVYHRILNIVPCGMQKDLVVYNSIYNSLYMLIQNSVFIPSQPLEYFVLLKLYLPGLSHSQNFIWLN